MATHTPPNRNDLTALKDAIKGGAKRKLIFEEHTDAAFKYQRGIEAAIQVYSVARDKTETPVIKIYWGPSGTGKSLRATTEYPDAYICTEPNGNGTMWWDGYEGQKVVIFDEFYGWIKYSMLLRLLDRYPLRVQVKGGSVDFVATTFVFTSNKPWQEWYGDNVKEHTDDLAALRRRITEWGTVLHMVRMQEIDLPIDDTKKNRLIRRMIGESGDTVLGFA